MRTLIYVLIPAVWLAAMALGVTMCRLAALSDRSQAVALAEWLATSCRAQRENMASENLADLPPYEPKRGAYRATG